MFTEARKLHLIENVIKLTSEDALVQIEGILSLSFSDTTKSRSSAHKFLGKISKKDISLMETAIQEGCEQVDIDGWK